MGDRALPDLVSSGEDRHCEGPGGFRGSRFHVALRRLHRDNPHQDTDGLADEGGSPAPGRASYYCTGTFVINLITGFYTLILPGDMSAGVMRWHKLSRPSGKRAEVLAALVFLRLINSSVILLFGVIALLIDDPFDKPVISFTAIALLAGIIVRSFWKESLSA